MSEGGGWREYSQMSDLGDPPFLTTLTHPPVPSLSCMGAPATLFCRPRLSSKWGPWSRRTEEG